MKITLPIMLLCSSFMLYGCTAREVYESAKARNEVECRRLPTSEYEDCVRTFNEDYQKYREQREEVIRDRQ